MAVSVLALSTVVLVAADDRMQRFPEASRMEAAQELAVESGKT